MIFLKKKSFDETACLYQKLLTILCTCLVAALHQFSMLYLTTGYSRICLNYLNLSLMRRKVSFMTVSIVEARGTLSLPCLHVFKAFYIPCKLNWVPWFPHFSSKVLVLHEPSNIEISKEKFQCLRPRCWLNDEVILLLYFLNTLH
jgi:hypothetical protein